MAYSKQNFQNGQILNAANLEKMENGIIAGQGARNLLVNSDFRNPIDIDNLIGTVNVNPCFTRWNFERASSSVTTQIIKIDNGIRVYKNGGVARFYQSLNDNFLNKIVSYAINTSEGIFVGSCTVSSSSSFTRIGTHTAYISAYQSSSSGNLIFSLYFNDSSEDAIDIYWAALYEGSYTIDTLPDYVPKPIQQEMLDCGVPLYPKNLLKNSNFTNPSNVKRGMTSYSGSVYDIIDLWNCATPDGSTTTTKLTSNGLNFTHSDGSSMIYLRQNVSDFWKNNKAYTLGCYKDDGTFFYSGYYNSGDGKINIVIPSGTTVTSVVCYEGKYTEDMLPPYVPKDKYIEMLNCGVPTSPRNILKNSDFIHPLNTTGFKSKSSGDGVLIDGWSAWIAGNGGNIELTSSGIKLSPPSSENIGIYQNIENYELNKIYTIVVYINNTPYIKTFQMGNWGAGTDFGPISFFSIPTSNVLLRINSTNSAVTIQKAALYEGAYTIDTLPGYISNTKHVEMLNCNVPFAPHNLLDNSNFLNPVNQRGQSSWSAIGYTIDRWRTYYVVNVSLTSSGIKVDATSAAGNFRQNISSLPNGTYTFAAYVNGVIKTRVFTNDNGTITTVDDSNARFTGGYISAGKNSDNYYVQVVNTSGYTNTIAWAALYEGAYDASTLPAYVPKGYAVELAECQRYYRTMTYPVIPCANNPAGTQVYGFLPFRMRIDNPTISCDTLYYFKGDTTFYTVSSASGASYGVGTRIVFNLSSNVEGNLAGAVAGNGITLSADL